MILKGDCIEVMKAIKPNSMDAVVCDPPYGLEFMGKEWDKLWDSRNKDEQDNEGVKTFLRVGRNLTAYKAGLEMQLWHTQWLTEAYRVLKPGGSMLVMGGTRTFHRLACAIEDSGFIIKDTLMWLYGSGFPKAQDLGKMIDKRMGNIKNQSHGFNTAGGKENFKPQNKSFRSDYGYQYNPEDSLAKHWDGFKVGGIKPAYEPIIWAVKPPEGSYVDNVLKWGVGAVNVDECRVNVDNDEPNKRNNPSNSPNTIWNNSYTRGATLTKGRFPANVILSHHPECVQVGMKKIKSPGGNGITTAKSHFQRGEIKSGNFYADKDGLETVESWDCHPECAVRLLDEQSGNLQSGENPKRRGSAVFKNCYGEFQGQENCMNHYSRGANSGGASRFFYCAKASRGERNAGLEGMEEKPIALNTGNAHNVATLGRETRYGNNHPTVKPIKLFEYLIKLVTREGQIILDPFIGSGTTAIAAHNTGRKCVGIEKEDEYLTIAKRRIDYWESQPKQMEMGL